MRAQSAAETTWNKRIASETQLINYRVVRSLTVGQSAVLSGLCYKPNYLKTPNEEPKRERVASGQMNVRHVTEANRTVPVIYRSTQCLQIRVSLLIEEAHKAPKAHRSER